MGCLGSDPFYPGLLRMADPSGLPFGTTGRNPKKKFTFKYSQNCGNAVLNGEVAAKISPKGSESLPSPTSPKTTFVLNTQHEVGPRIGARARGWAEKLAPVPSAEQR